MREQLLSAVRHAAGAAAAAVTGYLASRGYAFLSPEDLVKATEGVTALIVGFSFAAYAGVEKLLKPVFRSLFGSSGE